MKKMFTPSIAISLLLLLSGSLIPLMAQSEEQIERFKKEREAFFTERLELTTKESEDFWCIYDDFYNRKMKLAEDERNAFSYAHQNADNLTDNEVTELLDKITDLKEEQIQLENDYFKNKFTEVLPPKKVMKLYQVDLDFRRYLLRRLRDQQRDDSGGANRRTGSRPPQDPYDPFGIPHDPYF